LGAVEVKRTYVENPPEANGLDDTTVVEALNPQRQSKSTPATYDYRRAMSMAVRHGVRRNLQYREAFQKKMEIPPPAMPATADANTNIPRSILLGGFTAVRMPN
jgi:hypothetical protein